MMKNSAGANRLDALDGLRGIAILLVITIHCTACIDPRDFGAYLFRMVFAGTYGDISVDLFFVLSGYLITRILLNIQGKPHYFSSFYSRRFCRILPLYFLSLALFIYGTGWLPAQWREEFAIMPWERPWFWMFLSNYNTKLLVYPYAHFWTLGVEMHFYLLWPVVVYFIPAKHLFRVTVALIIAVTLVRWAHVYYGAVPQTTYIRTHTRIDMPLFGALVAILEYHNGGLVAFRGRASKLLVAGAAGLCVLAYFSNGLRFTHPLTAIFGFTLNGIAFASLLTLSLQPEPHVWIRRICGNSFLVACGKYSYGMYIFHLPLLQLISLLVIGATPYKAAQITDWQIQWTILLWSLTIASSFLTGFLTWNLLEKHFLKFKFYRITK